MKLAPGLHRVGSDLVNAYLIADADGITVVDAGLPGHWADLQAELAAMGRTVADIRGVVLTHGDTDHLGFAERLRAEAGVPVHVHALDAARARGEDKANAMPSWREVRPGPLGRFLWYSARRGGLRVPPVAEVVAVPAGATLDLPGAPRVLHLPGHTPGSIAVHVPAVDAVLVGDALTTGHVLTGAQGPRPAPFTLDPETALRSLAALEALEATWVLPGHGAPWSGGTDAVVRQVRAVAAAGG